MKSIFTPLVITTTTAFIGSCGNDNSPSNVHQPNSTWRIASRVISYNENFQETALEEAIGFEYDSHDELIRITGRAPQSGDNILSTGPTFVLNDDGEFILSESALESGEIGSNSSIQTKTEIINFSPSHWVHNNYIYRAGIINPNTNSEWHLRSIAEFLDWGDNKYIWGYVSDEWFDAESDITDRPPVTEQQERPTDWSELSPKLHIIREYNDSGYLTYRAIYTHDQSRLMSEDIFEYRGGITLAKITSHYSLADYTINESLEFVFDDSTTTSTTIRNFTFIANNTLQIETLSELNGELTHHTTETATYEQAPCGPITLERSKKAVPVEFPVCIQK